ncbi:MAG TPA: hypothetical protein VE078_03580 [Thermoanaerobaculia bacterium]|nr:hypothetical protein [Thermoanaerobaculia bacterium]
MKPKEEVLSAVLELLGKQIEVLDGAESVFQQAQRMLPLPSARELAEMKRGMRPVSRTVYLLWFLQRGHVALEEIASGLRVEIEDGTSEVPIEGSFSAIQFNTVEQAIRTLKAEETP